MLVLYYVYPYRSWRRPAIPAWLHSPARVGPDRAYKYIDLFILSWLLAAVLSATYTCGRRWLLQLHCHVLFLDTASCIGRSRCFLWLVFWIASTLRRFLCGCISVSCVVAFLFLVWLYKPVRVSSDRACGRRWSLHLHCRALFLDTAPCTGRIRCFLWLVFWIASALRCLLCGCISISCVVAFLLSWFWGCCLLVAFCNFSCTCKIPCLILIF